MSEPRYSIGFEAEDPETVLIVDHVKHAIILRGGKVALPLIRELVDAANENARPTGDRAG